MTNYALPMGQNGRHDEEDAPRPTHTPPSLPHLLVASNLRDIAARVKSGLATTHDAARLESLAVALDSTYETAMALRQWWPSAEEIREKIAAAGGVPTEATP